jgi:hypothetical protein
LDVAITGDGLDLGPLLDSRRDDGGEARGECDAGGEGSLVPRVPLLVRLDVARLGLGAGRDLRGAVGRLDLDGAGGLTLDLDGSLGGQAPTRLGLVLDAAGVGRLTLSSADAGGLLRAGRLARRVVGGKLDATADLARSPDAGWTAEGLIEIADMVVTEDGALDALLVEADLEVALTQLRDEGIRFQTARLPFQWRPGRLRLVEAVAHGPILGITLSGDFDTARDRLDMAGVFTPLYGISGLLGGLPIIGEILTGGEGEGLIAFTFDLEGSLDKPEVMINPLSALLPGILRRLIQSSPAPG